MLGPPVFEASCRVCASPSTETRKPRIMLGQEEGERCGRDGCNGIIAVRPVENCSCHIHPPCPSCTDPREYCPECDWHAEDDNDYVPVMVATGLAMMERRKPRPLDPTKIDYRTHPHSNSSQRVEGVYPPGTSRADVEARVRGTFGGRFTRFSDGKFEYIAYTD